MRRRRVPSFHFGGLLGARQLRSRVLLLCVASRFVLFVRGYRHLLFGVVAGAFLRVREV